MSVRLSAKHFRQLEGFLSKVINAYKNNELTDNEATGELTHLFAAALQDNEGEVVATISDPEIFERILRTAHGGKL